MVEFTKSIRNIKNFCNKNMLSGETVFQINIIRIMKNELSDSCIRASSSTLTIKKVENVETCVENNFFVIEDISHRYLVSCEIGCF